MRSPPMRKARSALRSKYRLPKIAKCKKANFRWKMAFFAAMDSVNFFQHGNMLLCDTPGRIDAQVKLQQAPEISPIGSYKFYHVFLFCRDLQNLIRYNTFCKLTRKHMSTLQISGTDRRRYFYYRLTSFIPMTANFVCVKELTLLIAAKQRSR